MVSAPNARICRTRLVPRPIPRLAMRLAALMATLMATLLAGPGTALAQAPAQGTGWCVQCHGLASPQGRGLPLGQMAWQGPLAQEDLTPCPGLRRARRELLAADTRLSALSALMPGLAADRLTTAGLERGLARAAEQKRQALSQPVSSLEEIGQRLALSRTTLMEQVERPYREQQNWRAAGSAWGLALMVLLALAMALLWGLRRLCQPGGPLAGPAPGGPADGIEPPLKRVRRGELP